MARRSEVAPARLSGVVWWRRCRVWENWHVRGAACPRGGVGMCPRQKERCGRRPGGNLGESQLCQVQ